MTDQTLMTNTFNNLEVGDRFDFISPDSRLNSFYKRCTKIGPRKYRDEDGFIYVIGSTKAKVYNVEDCESAS